MIPRRRFSPGQLTGAIWLSARKASSLITTDTGSTPVSSSGDAIGKWLDLSGRGYHATQSAAGKRPTYSPTGGVNGLPGVTSDGVDDYLATPAFSAFQGAMFVVLKVISQGLYTGYAKLGASPTSITNDGVMVSRNGASDKWGVSSPQTGPGWFRFRKGNGTIDPGSSILLSWRWGTALTDVMVRKNGTDYPLVDVEGGASYAARTVSANPIHLFCGYSTYYANVCMSEFVALPYFPSASDIQLIESYLRGEYGL